MRPLFSAGSGIPHEAATWESNVAATRAIDDCRSLMDSGRSHHTGFLIVDRQSAIGNENLVFGCGYAALSGLLSQSYVVEEEKLQNQMVAGELIRQGREGDGSADACQSRTVERVGA